MSLFAKAVNEQAYAKVGTMGFQGSGKTHTSALITIGLHKLLTERNLPGGGDTPVFFLDTETGSDWVIELFEEAGVDLVVSKTRAFKDLIPATEEVEGRGGILLIDSVTHFWRELTEAYVTQKRRTRLMNDDWTYLKTQWGRFSDRFVNGHFHCVMCGRAGYEYGNEEDEAGRREVVKTHVKMRAEGETGYEPSLLIFMQRHEKDLGAEKKVWRSATVMKDRSRRLDGKIFEQPKFENFLPHFEYLNFGSAHRGVDTDRTSKHMIPADGRSYGIRRDVCVDEIKMQLYKHWPSQSADDKSNRADVCEKIFDTRSWKAIEALGLDDLENGRNLLWIATEGKPYDPASVETKEEMERDAF